MCHPVGAAGAATIVAGGTAVWLYTGHRVGLNEALGGLAAVEVVVAMVMIMWMVLSMRRAHAPGNIVEHLHTHPLHRHKHPHSTCTTAGAGRAGRSGRAIRASVAIRRV